MYMCMCVYVYMCVCVCSSLGTYPLLFQAQHRGSALPFRPSAVLVTFEAAVHFWTLAWAPQLSYIYVIYMYIGIMRFAGLHRLRA